MKVKIDKTLVGFNFRIGDLLIARSDWKRTKTGWQIELYCMKEGVDRNGILVAESVGVFRNLPDAVRYLEVKMMMESTDADAS